MDNRKTIHRIIIFALVAMILASAAGYALGRNRGREEILSEQQALFELNRESISLMDGKEHTVWVIGHMSPDTDTVVSAIAYARLLTLLGYDARPAVTAPVNNETAYALLEAGVPVPAVLEDASGEYIFLVDHSEYRQAAPGMEDAHIVGIIDHHGVGSVTTGAQLLYDARPIGATATIVWLSYVNYGLEVDETTAYLLACAILSDTGNLKSSTTTEADRTALRVLSEKAGITDVEALYRILYEKLLSYDGMTDLEIIFSDFKRYEASGVTFGIGTVNAVDENAAKELAEKLKDSAPEAYTQAGLDLLYISISIRTGTEKYEYVVPADEASARILTEAFPEYEFDGTSYIYRKGLGRKTVFVPGLTEYLGAHPHE